MSVKKLVFRPGTALVLPHPRPDVRARPACHQKDANAIAVVVENSHGGDYQPLNVGGLWGELRGREGRRVIVWLAFIDHAPVGVAAVVSAGNGGTVRHSIAWLLVGREARRRGVGSTLVAAIVRDALDRGIGELWVETRSDWSAALAFWQAVGFQAVP